MEAVEYYVIKIIVASVALFVSAKLLSIDVSLPQSLITIFATVAAAMIPWVGFITSIIVFCYFLKRYSRAPVYPDIIIVLIISTALNFGLLLWGNGRIFTL